MHFKYAALLFCSLFLSIAFPGYSEVPSAAVPSAAVPSAAVPSAAVLSAGSYQFERIGPFGGDVRSLLMDSRQPRTIYLGTSVGKLFKSSDAGSSWAPLQPGIGPYEYVIDTLVQHPAEPDHIYAGAWDLHSEGGGLFESADAGISWTRVALPNRFSAVRGFAICRSAPARMIAGTLGGVFISADGGRTWKQTGGSELSKAESVAIDPVDPKFLYVGTWRLAYRSHDFGRTWVKIDKGMPLDSDVFSIAVGRQDPAIIYSSACSGAYRSVNRGQSWTRLKILPDRFTIRAQVIYQDPADPHRVYSGTTEGLFVSNNDGQKWARLTPPDVTVNAIQVNPANNKQILIGTEYQGNLQSRDEGKSWEESNAGFIHKQISWILPDPSATGNLIAGLLSGAGGFYRYNEHTQQWTLSQIESGMRVYSFLCLPKDYGNLVGTSQGVYWQDAKSGRWKKMAGSIGRRTVYSLAIDPASPVIYAGTDQGVLRTTLSAMEFRMPPANRLSPKTWCVMAPALPAAPGMIYAATSLGLLRSLDKGTTWNVISLYGLPERVIIDALAVSPSDQEHLLAGTSAGLFESKNGGVHWRKVADGTISASISAVVFLDDSGKRILAGDKTSGGLYYSKDGGETWGRIFSGEFASPVYCIARHPKAPSQIFLGTRSDGVYRLTLPDIENFEKRPRIFGAN